MKSSIPKIDYEIISNQENLSFNDELKKFNHAISHYGFLLLKNTPIDKEVKNNILKTYKAFFDLPFEKKNLINMSLTSSNRGWGAPYGEQVNPEYNSDYKEIFDSGPHKKARTEFKHLTYYSENLWPDQLPFFEKNINNYYDLCTDIGINVLSFIEHSLNFSKNFFRDKFENPMSLLRCNYYPPRVATLSNKHYGIAPHTDYGCLTILLTDNNPGLEIKNPSNEWELVLPEEGEVVVNFGDMLEFWSDKKIKATSHRVYGNNNTRFSIPFFFNPQYDTIISKKDNIIAGEYLSKKYDSTYTHKKKYKNFNVL
jgi:isopenicillin N synthase-like dioxygenase